jgi:hypothetical protein
MSLGLGLPKSGGRVKKTHTITFPFGQILLVSPWIIPVERANKLFSTWDKMMLAQLFETK